MAAYPWLLISLLPKRHARHSVSPSARRGSLLVASTTSQSIRCFATSVYVRAHNLIRILAGYTWSTPKTLPTPICSAGGCMLFCICCLRVLLCSIFCSCCLRFLCVFAGVFEFIVAFFACFWAEAARQNAKRRCTQILRTTKTQKTSKPGSSGPPKCRKNASLQTEAGQNAKQKCKKTQMFQETANFPDL